MHRYRTPYSHTHHSEVEDIYDIENGNMSAPKEFGLLNALGDFVNGMMAL